MQALNDWLFLDLATRSGDVGYIAERAVLAPLNVDSMVDKINDTVAASRAGGACSTSCSRMPGVSAENWASSISRNLMNISTPFVKWRSAWPGHKSGSTSPSPA